MKLPALISAELYKQFEDGTWNHIEGPWLLSTFEIGQPCRVGSRFSRTLEPDWWQTSYVLKIREVREGNSMGKAVILFETYSGSVYSLVLSVETYSNNVNQEENYDTRTR